MKKKHIAVEGTIVHPTGRTSHDLVQHGSNLIHVVVATIGVHHHSIMSTAFVKIRFLKVAHLHRRIDSAIVVLGDESIYARPERCGDAPSLRHISESQSHRRISRIHRIHQDLSQIEKCVMRIELSAKRAGRIGEYLIIDHGAALRARDLPPALIQLTDSERAAGAVFRAHPVYILREVPYLIQRVPHRKLQLALRRSLWQNKPHFHKMLIGACQRNCVVGCCIGRRRGYRYQQRHENKLTRRANFDAGKPHHFPAAFAEMTLAPSPASARNRAGNFS